MPYDDDKFGRIWPTRQGNAIGGARERQMLDAIGGSEGFRTRYSYNPDGSITELRTKDGMPQFITRKKKIPVAVTAAFSSAFYATPTSLANSNGYTPTATPALPGPHSEWLDYHVLPISLPGAYPAPEPVLSPRYPVSDTRGTGTWFGDVVVGGKRLVIGWYDGNARAGNFPRYEAGSQLVRQYYERDSFPTKNSLLSMNTCVEPGTVLWVGHKLKIDLVSVVIHSAALRQVGAGYSLYVISGLDLYVSSGWEAVIGTDADGSTYIKSTIDPTTLTTLQTFTHVGTIPCPAPYSAWRVKQPLYFNHAGDKFATVADADYYKSIVVEFDVDTLSATEKASSQSWSIDPDGYIIPSGKFGVYSPLDAVFNHSGGWRRTRMLAADYRHDTGDLVWVSSEAETLFGGWEAHSTGASFSGSYPGTVTLSGSGYSFGYGQKVTIKINHSALGTLLTEVLVDKSTTVESSSSFSNGGSGDYDLHRVMLSGTHTTSMTESFPSRDYVSGDMVSVQNGDIRHGCFVLNIRWTHQTNSARSSTTNAWWGPIPTGGGTATSSGSMNTLTEVKRRILFAFDKFIRRQDYRVFTMTSSTGASTNALPASNTPAGYTSSGWPVSVGGAGVAHDDTLYKDTTVVGNWTTDASGFYTAEPYTFVAVDPAHRVAYASWKVSQLYTDTTPVYESFLVYDAATNTVVETAIPDQTYAPGASSTLVNPVFYSEDITQ